MAHPVLFFSYFRLFKHTIQVLQQINVKTSPSRIRCWDLNPQPLKHESPPTTTRPGLLPKKAPFFKRPIFSHHFIQFWYDKVKTNIFLLTQARQRTACKYPLEVRIFYQKIRVPGLPKMSRIALKQFSNLFPRSSGQTKFSVSEQIISTDAKWFFSIDFALFTNRNFFLNFTIPVVDIVIILTSKSKKLSRPLKNKQNLIWYLFNHDNFTYDPVVSRNRFEA